MRNLSLSEDVCLSPLSRILKSACHLRWTFNTRMSDAVLKTSAQHSNFLLFPHRNGNVSFMLLCYAKTHNRENSWTCKDSCTNLACFKACPLSRRLPWLQNQPIQKLLVQLQYPNLPIAFSVVHSCTDCTLKLSLQFLVTTHNSMIVD